MKPLRSIQILRAVAALGVLLFHACQWSGVDFAVGAAGVDLFFLISGFVLWLAADVQAPGPGSFLWARWARVAPLYWVWSLIAAAIAVARPQLLPVVRPELGHAMLSLAFIPHDAPDGGPFPLLPSGWTLTYEAFFYLTFALALTQPRAARFQVLAVVLTSAAISGFAFHRWYTLLANPLLLQFLVGAAVARRWRRQPFVAKGGWLWIGSGAVLLLVQQIAGVRDDFWRPILWGVPAFLILVGGLKLEPEGRPGALGRLFIRLGDASYSLYLCQIPVVCLMAAAAPGLPAPARIALTLAAALVVGLFSRTLIEAPLTQWLQRPVRRGEVATAQARA